ncbi:MAG: hypothetical protein KDE27_22100 [Planctomycetes bacterium]|nr:hypothetical protein [Planctomycetota bacterium]
MKTLRLVLWPTVITALVSIARLAGEVIEQITARSGGALAPLGITWCVFVFGGWFGYRLARGAGSRPTVKLAPLVGLLCMAALIGSVMWQFGPLLEAAPTRENFELVRAAVFVLVGIAAGLAVVAFVLWPRLAWTMLLYAIPARLTVLALTWLAKIRGWDTHYTKFGPPGIELDGIGETMLAATVAQIGFWVPFTIVGGTFAGMLVQLLFGRGVTRPATAAPLPSSGS